MSLWKSKDVSPFNMKFPEKLWYIVNECDTGAIGWGSTGETITLQYEKFQEEYLNKDIGYFKTKNIASFVRQLNLYGFRKCNRYNEDKHEFRHPLFMKDRKDLVDYIKRKPGPLLNFPSVRAPRGSKSKIDKQYSEVQKENATAKHLGSNSILRTSKSDSKRIPLGCHQYDPNVINPMRPFWWNNIPSAPYSSNFYYDSGLAAQGWMPMNASFYNSQPSIKREPGEPQDTENCYFNDVTANENQHIAPKSNSNMYFLVMPNYPSSPSHNIYTNTGYYHGMLPFPGMPMGPCPDGKNNNPYNGRIPVGSGLDDNGLPSRRMPMDVEPEAKQNEDMCNEQLKYYNSFH